MNRCAARGCGRWTRADETHCQRHREHDEDHVLERSPRGANEGEWDSFAERLNAGDYASLLPRGLRDALRQASADVGLEAEIGALRVALLRLLHEERDPSRMASGIARVTGVALQALREQQARSSAAAELQGIVERLLQVEAERDAGRAYEAAFVVREGGDDREVE